MDMNALFPDSGPRRGLFHRQVRRCWLLTLLLFLAAPALAACPRIVSQAPYLTLALQWLGQGPCIVGVSRYDRQLPQLPRTGGMLDPDGAAIAALKPDLIVASDWASAASLSAITPPGARLLRLNGFASLAETESMLATLARASRAPGARQKLQDFSRRWRQLAAQVQGKGRKVLLVSACSGSPYSFGRQHLVGDLFTQAGFEVVETAAKIRHLRPGAEIADLETLVERTRPDILVSFTPQSTDHCSMIAPTLPVRIVSLEGEDFFHPGPGLLRALAQMRERLGPTPEPQP